jgi:hypothetical protein
MCSSAAVVGPIGAKPSNHTETLPRTRGAAASTGARTSAFGDRTIAEDQQVGQAGEDGQPGFDLQVGELALRVDLEEVVLAVHAETQVQYAMRIASDLLTEAGS